MKNQSKLIAPTQTLKTLFAFVVLWMCCTEMAMSQDFLLLSWLRKDREIRFYGGEIIRYKLEGDKRYQQDRIIGFGQDQIFFNGYAIHVSQIEAVDIRRKPPQGLDLRQYASKMPVVSGFYLLITLINDNKIQGGDLIVSGSFLGLGGILYLLSQKNFEPGRNKKLNVVSR